MTPKRLHVFLAQQGVASRREAERMIDSGRVRVNGQMVQKQGMMITPGDDQVMVDGKVITNKQKKFRYFLFHKPRNVVSTLSDPFAEKTVYDFFRDISEKLVPAGRLDKNSTGLMLLTNDGELVLRLTHPRYGAQKFYRVRVKGHYDEAAMKRVESGVMIDGKKTAPCTIRKVKHAKGETELTIILNEGRKREIRRMMEMVELKVTGLRREKLGPFELGRLPEGARQELSAQQVAKMIQPLLK